MPASPFAPYLILSRSHFRRDQNAALVRKARFPFSAHWQYPISDLLLKDYHWSPSASELESANSLTLSGFAMFVQQTTIPAKQSLNNGWCVFGIAWKDVRYLNPSSHGAVFLTFPFSRQLSISPGPTILESDQSSTGGVNLKFTDTYEHCKFRKCSNKAPLNCGKTNKSFRTRVFNDKP